MPLRHAEIVVADPAPLPPDPGPQPELFEFPFSEAKAAMAEMETTIAALTAGVAGHARAATDAMVDFRGRTASEFQSAMAGQLDAIEAHVRVLDDILAQLDADVAEARRRRDASLDARALWTREMDDYEAALAAADDQ